MTVATQVISGVHVASDGGFVAGRVARATPVAGQHIDSSTVDATVLSSPISPIDGTWSLTLIRGVVYDVKIDRWAVRTIRVTDDPAQDFSYYLETSLEIADSEGRTIPPGSITQYLRGDRTWQTLDKAALGLTHVDDTSDAEKPLSLATLEALDEKLSRPALTPAGKQLTFDEAGEVVASTYDVGAAGGGGLASPDDLALALYGLGMMTVVAGPMVAGTDPPQMASSTAAQVAHLISIGIPEAYIGWNVTGSEAAGSTTGSFTLPSVTLTPVIVAPSLTGVQAGTFTLPGVTLTPAVSAPSLTGIQGGGFTLPGIVLAPVVTVPSLVGVQTGSFTLPAVTVQPQVSAPTLFGVQAGVGVFSMPSVILQPVIAAPTLAGVQVGSFALPAVTVQPQVSAPSLAGLQAGSFALPAVSLRPVVTTPTLVATVAATSGAFTLPAVTLQPVVTAPPLSVATPPPSGFTENFETRTTNSLLTSFGWTGGGATVSTALIVSGTKSALLSVDIDGASSDYIEIAVTSGGGNLTFNWRGSNDITGAFYVDGVLKASSVPPTKTAVSVTIAAGTHTLKWSASTGSVGSMAFDDIVVP